MISLKEMLHYRSRLGASPWEILGQEPIQDDKTIYAAYQRALDKLPADADGAAEARIKAAYRCVATSLDRRRWELLSPAGISDPAEITGRLRPQPRYCGPGPWLKTIRSLTLTGRHSASRGQRGRGGER